MLRLAPSGPFADGWQTVLDLDFASLPDESFAVDGPITVGGSSAIKENSASDRNFGTRIENGRGLCFESTDGPSYWDAGRAMPLIHWPITPWLMGMTSLTPWRVRCTIPEGLCNVSNAEGTLAIECTDSGITGRTGCAWTRQFFPMGTPNQGVGMMFSNNTTSGPLTISGTGAKDYVVYGMTCPLGIPCPLSLDIGDLAAGDWPEESAMARFGMASGPNVATGALVSPGVSYRPVADWGVTLAAVTPGPAPPGPPLEPTIVFGRLRIDLLREVTL